MLLGVDVALLVVCFRAVCPQGQSKELHRPKSSLQPGNSVYKSIDLPLKACNVL